MLYRECVRIVHAHVHAHIHASESYLKVMQQLLLVRRSSCFFPSIISHSAVWASRKSIPVIHSHARTIPSISIYTTTNRLSNAFFNCRVNRRRRCRVNRLRHPVFHILSALQRVRQIFSCAFQLFVDRQRQVRYLFHFHFHLHLHLRVIFIVYCTYYIHLYLIPTAKCKPVRNYVKASSSISSSTYTRCSNVNIAKIEI